MVYKLSNLFISLIVTVLLFLIWCALVKQESETLGGKKENIQMLLQYTFLSSRKSVLSVRLIRILLSVLSTAIKCTMAKGQACIYAIFFLTNLDFQKSLDKEKYIENFKPEPQIIA